MRGLYLKYKSYILYFFIFTFLFLLVKALFIYLLPFIISIFISFLMYPVYSFMKRRLSFKPAFSSTVITLFIFSVFIALVSFICYLIINESINLYSDNRGFFDKYLVTFDLNKLFTDFSEISDIIPTLTSTAFGVFRFIPLVVTLVLISFVSTIFFLNNLEKIKAFLVAKLSSNTSQMVLDVVNNGSKILRKFIKSYLILYLITFIESVFIFWLIGVDYVLVFAFLATVSDLLPVLGPGAVYLPLALYNAFLGNYLPAITLVIFWGITIIVRQILEPKFISETIKIHPLVIFSALYFSIICSNIWVLFYVLSITILYKILSESSVFEPILSKKTEDCKES